MRVVFRSNHTNNAHKPENTPKPNIPFALNCGSWNICRGFYEKKTEIEQIVNTHNISILLLQEVDLSSIDSKYPPELTGFTTFYPPQTSLVVKTRTLSFIKNDLAPYATAEHTNITNNIPGGRIHSLHESYFSHFVVYTSQSCLNQNIPFTNHLKEAFANIFCKIKFSKL